MRKKFNRKTITNMNLWKKYLLTSDGTKKKCAYVGNAVAVRKAFFLRLVPPREAYTRLEK
jgi:hypothetical protein